MVTYWYEKAQTQLGRGLARRFGLVATNMIRGESNNWVLSDAADLGTIYEAWSDEPWIVDGADVRVSIVCVASEPQQHKPVLDGCPTSKIWKNLSSGADDLTAAASLAANVAIAFRGFEKGGSFDISGEIARNWIALPLNPNGLSNKEVLRPLVAAADLVGRNRDRWLIDFTGRTEAEAALFEQPFSHLREHLTNRDC